MYEIDENKNTINIKDDGERDFIANFSATITKETRYDDGQKKNTILTVNGENKNEKFDEVEVPADKFASMGWIMSEWGVQAVIQPGNSAKENLRAAIQLASKPIRETIYTHTGWARIKKKNVYLHASGAIGENGNDPNTRVQLPPELSRYRLDANGNETTAIRAMLSFVKIAKPEITWPMLASAIAPLTGAVDFACHITGRTGTYKSEIASLLQCFYGQEMDARHLPGSWSSTPNALEAQAFRAKNAVFTIDDFIPSGTSWQQKSYQKTADQIIRGQGNQAGRARLTDVSNLQTTMYPRGLVLSTGEDTPEGHSVRGRMVIIEIAPDDVEITKLTAMQQKRELLSTGTAAYIRSLAKHLLDIQRLINNRSKKLRDEMLTIGHARTPSTTGRLIATIEHFLTWAVAAKHITQNECDGYYKEGAEAIITCGKNQTQYLEEADPCEMFCESIRHILAAHIGHVRTINGGIPALPTNFGWTAETTMGDIPTYKCHGKCIGWMNWDTDELYIDVTAAYSDIKRHANNQITFTKQTMLKRLKDSGLLTRVDDTRQRNTIRITAEGHPRSVLAMSLTQTLQLTEKP